VRGLVGDVRAVAVYLTPLAFEIAPQPSNNPNGPPLPHPAAPVQHQPKPCCTVLRLAPRRSRRVGETRASPVAFSNRPLALIAAAPPLGVAHYLSVGPYIVSGVVDSGRRVVVLDQERPGRPAQGGG
jgi:hypothetical protein